MRNLFRAAVSFLTLVTLAFGTAAAGFATVTGNEPIYVHSATCTPGGTATIQIHGKVDDPSADVSFDFANAPSGTAANTGLGSTDNMDAAFANTGGPLNPSTTTGHEGKYWTEVTVTCPADACPGQAAVVQATLKVNGVAVATDTGCVTVRGAKPKVSKTTYAGVDATETHHHVGVPGTLERVAFVVTNTGFRPHQFLVISNTFNSQDPGGQLYPIRPEEGFVSFSYIEENMIEGKLRPLSPGESMEVSVWVQTPFDAEIGSGNTLNLSVVDENTGEGINGSAVVMMMSHPDM